MTDTYLRQKWSDPRLSHADIKSPLDLADPNLVKAIWKPEVFFPNAKEANFQVREAGACRRQRKSGVCGSCVSLHKLACENDDNSSGSFLCFSLTRVIANVAFLPVPHAVCDCSQRPHPDPPRGRDTLHTEVKGKKCIVVPTT